MDNSVSKSWFCVFNNPVEHGFDGSPEEILDKLVEAWVTDNPQRTCAVTYCISEDGLEHCHAVFEDTKAMRFSAIKKVFPSMHIEPTKGNKEQAEDYINKRGKFEEKGEKIICIRKYGEIKGCQGQRRDLSIIEELINDGKTPNEIFEMSFAYRRYSSMIKEAYFHKRAKETYIKRDIVVYWHVGASGSGKSHEIVDLSEKHGEDNVYMVSEYDHGFDKYNGEPVLFMDEFRGQMRYAQLLVMLDGYKVQIACRYANVIGLWSEVHITSVLPPESVYHNMVSENKSLDTMEQLKRRLDFVVYHYRDGNEYCKKEVPIKDYKDYTELVRSVPQKLPEWVQDEMGEVLPF